MAATAVCRCLSGFSKLLADRSLVEDQAARTPARRHRRLRNLSGQVVGVRPPLFPRRPGRDPLTQAGTQAVEAPPELVAVALHRVFEGQVRELAPGQASKQEPAGPLRNPPRVGPNRATAAPHAADRVT